MEILSVDLDLLEEMRDARLEVNAADVDEEMGLCLDLVSLGSRRP